MLSNEELMKVSEELINKGIVSTSALATAGKLNPEQAEKMIDYIFDETKLRSIVRLVRMKAEQTHIDKIGVGKRVAVPKNENVDPGVRRGVTHSKIELNKKTIMVPFEITAEYLEDNIEGMAVEDHIAKMMGTAFGNDLEGMYISGNTLGPAVPEEDIIEGGSPNYVVDGLLGLVDGWIKKCSAGHIVDFDSAGISSNVFTKMKKALPTKFRKNLPGMRFFMPMDTEETYRQVLASRGTALGDNALQSGSNLPAMGVAIQSLALMDAQPMKVAHVTLTGVTPVQLNGDKNISDAVAHLQSLAATPTAPIADPSDIEFDLVAGTVERSAGSSLPSPVNVKVTYRAQTEILLTEGRNLILGIGRDITINKDFDIFKDVKQFAMTVRVGVAVEETDATVLGKNLLVE